MGAMRQRAGVLPFSALVGQDAMKRALLLNAVNPAIGGVLIRGQKGTAKSTAVRGLTELLPDVEVVAGCRFHCDPGAAGLLCDECRARADAGETLHSKTRRMTLVELPVNASEDRVVGSIDVEAAIKRGERRFEPGLLAAANRNLLYVDEVNLLDDHLVDVLLDAAAMGVNTVEREGVSLSHPARLMLVGTMNPEEGELRPQLLDRFGLCVDVGGLQGLADRVRVMERAAADGAPRSDDVNAAQRRLRATIARATELLPLVRVPAAMRQFIALICVDAGAVGHRADIVISRTAQTMCAWREAEALIAAGSTDPITAVEALSVTAEDVITAAELALAHRRRDRPSQDSSSAATSPTESASERMEELRRNAEAAADSESSAEAEESEVPQESASSADEGTGSSRGDEARAAESASSSPPQMFAGDLFPVRKISLPRDRRTRKATGKRSQARSKDRRGRYVRAVQSEHTTDVAFDATVRAAAPHQRRRRSEAAAAGIVDAPALHLERQDLRQKVRRRRTGTLIVFVVDASASMDAEQRMQATKGAVLSLLRDAYVRRDKVSLVVFSGRSARVVLQPTSSVDLAEERLQRLAVGGTTPLTHGLVAGLRVVRTERLRESSVYPLIVLISDGRGNISLFGEEPLLEAQRLAAQIGNEHVRMLVIDSARDHIAATPLPRVGAAAPSQPSRSPLFSGGYGFNACLDLADRSGGEYLGLYDLSQGAILAGVERSLRAR
jgi:magnesium chelatase subunit D